VALAAVPFLVPLPAQAACGDIRTNAAGVGAMVQQLAYTAAEPSATPCPSTGPLGPTTDDGGDSNSGKAAGLAVAAVALIVGGIVLRRRAGRN
jgi:hypothetical protein